MREADLVPAIVAEGNERNKMPLLLCGLLEGILNVVHLIGFFLQPPASPPASGSGK